MSLLGTIEAAAETAVPPLRAARFAVIVGLVILVLVGLSLACWWFFVRPQAAQAAAQTAKVQSVTAAATSSASQDAVRIVTVHDKEVDRINTITQGGANAVRSAADAATPVPAVARALRGALCLYDAYRGDSGCAAVRGSGQGVGSAQPDAGGAAAGR